MREGCGNEAAGNPLDLIYPHVNAVVYVPLEISGETGRVVFEAAHREPGTTIFWHLDGDFLGSTTNLHQIAVNPLPGLHQIILIDTKGNRIERAITVLCKE
jgi:penicillin-binding protein 1C